MHFNVQQAYFAHIAQGRKTAEGRIAKSKYRSLKPGQSISFSPNEDSSKVLNATVMETVVYDTFQQMLEQEGLSNMLPGVDSIEEGVRIYSSFGTYSEDVKKHGCVSVRFKLNK